MGIQPVSANDLGGQRYSAVSARLRDLALSPEDTCESKRDKRTMGSDDLTSRWKMSSHSGGNGECVELANTGAVRDSKNPVGPVVQIDPDHFVNVVRTDRLNR